MNEWLERKVKGRLREVADQMQGPVAADIGSDHAYLPAYLLRSGRVQRMIVVEKNLAPFQRSRQALRRLSSADVRLGDGLGPIAAGEIDSLSMSGYGAALMVKILAAHPERVPPLVVAQCNDEPEPLRRWALQNGYRIRAEKLIEGRFPILALLRACSRITHTFGPPIHPP